MKNLLFSLLILFCFLSCTSSVNSPEFIKKTEGRYLFNEDETIEVYFKDQKLFVKWRGNDHIEPLKVNDSTFYVKELNEKLIFTSLPNLHIKLASKREHKGETYTFSKLSKGEKTPSEYLNANQFDLALKGYLTIQERDSLNPTIRERHINSLGYKAIKKNKIEKAVMFFKINIALHPKSSNTYDSMGDAYLKLKDTTMAIDFYKKALAINPENRSSKRNLEKITK